MESVGKRIMAISRSYEFRRATDKDKEQLKSLFELCFGKFAEENGALDWIDGRYIVAELHTCITATNFDKKEIVAVTGILPKSKSAFQGYEVTWTCTHPDHRKRGLVSKMLQLFEQQLPEDAPLFCDCWRIKDNDDINLTSVMRHMGMIEILHGHTFRDSHYHKQCENCCQKIGEDCYCYNDLYMKFR